MPETKRLIATFTDLPDEVQNVTARHLVGSKILQITSKAAHGVVEHEIAYTSHGDLHKLHYDETTHKLLGGTAPGVIAATLVHVPLSGRNAIRAAGADLHELKIKHDGRDDREFLHATFRAADGYLTGAKFEMDGSAKRA